MAVHETAVVDKTAELDSRVDIGPYAVIGADVKIGAHTKIEAHSVVSGPTVIGERNLIGSFATVGGAPQDVNYKGEPTELIIGDDNLPGRVAAHASQMYSSNLLNLITHFWDAEAKELKLDTEEEIAAGALVAYEGKLVNEMLQKAYSQQ